MKNAYVNFMNIKLSNEDRKNIFDYLRDSLEYSDDAKYDVYSKIVIQFNLDSEYERFEDDKVDTDCYVLCHEFNDKQNQYIMYAIDENAFEDVLDIFKEYDCNIYQFIIDEDSNYFDINDVDDFFNV